MYRSGGQRVRAIAAPDAIGGLLGVEEFPAWPSTLPLPAAGLLRPTAPTGRTGPVRASPTCCCDVRSHVVSGYVDWRSG